MVKRKSVLLLFCHTRRRGNR